jgi:hypothetical protein
VWPQLCDLCEEQNINRLVNIAKSRKNKVSVRRQREEGRVWRQVLA